MHEQLNVPLKARPTAVSLLAMVALSGACTTQPTTVTTTTDHSLYQQMSSGPQR